jgi:serine/threonine protein kinase
MWSEPDRRLAQVLIQARATSVDDLHALLADQEAERAGSGEPPTLAELIRVHGLMDPERLEGYVRAASVPHEPVDVVKTAPLAPRREGGDVDASCWRTLGGYDLIAPLASGSSGTVFRARDPRTGELVAVKVLRSRDAREHEAERFLREAQVAFRLEHQNLVSGIAVGVQDGLYYFVMELVEGESAGARLRREGRLPEVEVVDLGRAICAALDCAREHGIVHRDVKPDNILIDTEGRVTLCDLGLARPIGKHSSVTTTGIAVGTPRYIAPEQARGTPDIDHRADIYSLGITLFHLVTGEAPFDGASGLDVLTKHLYEDVPSIRTRCAELGADLDYVIRRATRKRPADRYQTAGAMGRDLAALRVRMLQEACPLDAAEPARHPGSRRDSHPHKEEPEHHRGRAN